MLFKLAFRNVKRQIGDYLVYFITVSLAIALMFAVNNLIFSDIMTNVADMVSYLVKPVLLAVSAILAIVIAVVLSYATAFLLRRRKKEFGLYLTMGMTRNNIVAVFAGETAITFLFALGIGLALGALLYQALMLVFVSILSMKYTLTGYSLTAILVTVGMVGGMFLVSSIASLGYLKLAKISSLLQGEKTSEKTVKPVFVFVWAAVFALAVGGLTWAVVAFRGWYQDDFWNRVGELIPIIVVAIISIILIPMGFSKAVVTLILYIKPLSTRGTARFTVRQLSGRLNANSVMLGVLSLLLCVAVIAPNIFFINTTTAERNAALWYPFDAVGSREFWGDGTDEEVTQATQLFENGLQEVDKRVSVANSHIFTLYAKTEWDTKWGSFHDEFYMKESDFSSLCAMFGYTMPALNGKYLYCDASGQRRDNDFVYQNKPLSTAVTIEGRNYASAGRMTCPRVLNRGITVKDEWRVLPDSAFTQSALQSKELKYDSVYITANFASNNYDVYELKAEFGQYVTFQEYERIDSLTGIALFLLGDLFVSAVFLLLTMAMLALKMLATVSEDGERYKTLWRLGASKGMIAKSLFTQMFFFFFTPFLLPLAGCFPLASVLITLAEKSMALITAGEIIAQIAIFAGVILALYAIYFTLSYIVAWRDVKKRAFQDTSRQ